MARGRMTPKPQPGIYMIRCRETGLVKVGQSRNVAKRLQRLSSRDPATRYKLRFDPLAFIYYPEPKRMEAWALEQLQLDGRRAFHPRVKGIEWADISRQEALTLAAWLLKQADWLSRQSPRTITEEVVRNPYDGPVTITRTIYPNVTPSAGVIPHG